MSDIQTIIKDFRNTHLLSYRQLAQLIKDELERREYPPNTLTHMAVYHWERGAWKPDPMLVEWLLNNAQDPAIRELAGSLMDALTNNGKQQ